MLLLSWHPKDTVRVGFALSKLLSCLKSSGPKDLPLLDAKCLLYAENTLVRTL